MRLTIDQIFADKARMEQFICERIPPCSTRINLGGGAWADLTPCWDELVGWSLLWETDEPEWVGLREVYQYFRRREMTWREWWAEIQGEVAQAKVRSLESEVAVLLEEMDKDAAGDPKDYAVAVDENGLPKEVSTAEAARILGVSKDTVLKLRGTGLLEYRNTGCPESSRPVFAFSLRSIIELRTSYERDSPLPRRPQGSARRRIKVERKYKHLRLTKD
jgi:hypothetical protein